jgi:hypothetical protein
MSSIVANIKRTLVSIKAAARSAQREEASVTLLAVSKTRPASEVREAFAAGQTQFGENYLQDALKKIDALQDLPVCWHFIGPIQSNKTRPVAEHFQWVHTIDRVKIAQRLSSQRPEQLPALNLCIQVNISAEANKSGVSEEEVEELAAAISELPRVRLRGLMAIPAAVLSPEEQRQTFQRMRHLLEKLQEKYPKLDTLSMGMSQDLEPAIQEGATMVRVGTAIFGLRSQGLNDALNDSRPQ